MAKFHQNGGKGHGNLEPVPAVETPEPLGLNVKGQYGHPCFTGEPYGPGLRFVPWASGTIRSNAQSKPLLQLAYFDFSFFQNPIPISNPIPIKNKHIFATLRT